jgi:hypothetical protein
MLMASYSCSCCRHNAAAALVQATRTCRSSLEPNALTAAPEAAAEGARQPTAIWLQQYGRSEPTARSGVQVGARHGYIRRVLVATGHTGMQSMVCASSCCGTYSCTSWLQRVENPAEAHPLGAASSWTGRSRLPGPCASLNDTLGALLLDAAVMAWLLRRWRATSLSAVDVDELLGPQLDASR